MKVETVDGRTVYTFRQSGVGEFLLCNERARVNWLGHVEDGPSDATAIGTAVHAGAEAILRGGNYFDGEEAAQASLYDEWNHPLFRAVQTKNYATAQRYVETCLAAWYDRVFPQLGEAWLIEKDFDLHFGYHPRTGAEIRLRGTIDYGDPIGLWDWKTAGDDRKYGNEAWKLSRWAVQPTTYTWAAHELELYDEPVTFSWAAMTKGARSNVQIVECKRGRADWDWLLHVLVGIIDLYEANLERWPVNDQHALCSAKWCANWYNCKGRYT